MTAGTPRGVAVDLLPAGDEGLLLEVADLADVLALEPALRTALATGEGPWREVTDVVPAARTVLLLTDAGAGELFRRLADQVRRGERSIEDVATECTALACAMSKRSSS